MPEPQVRCTFSVARAWRPAVGASLPQTLFTERIFMINLKIGFNRIYILLAIVWLLFGAFSNYKEIATNFGFEMWSSSAEHRDWRKSCIEGLTVEEAKSQCGFVYRYIPSGLISNDEASDKSFKFLIHFMILPFGCFFLLQVIYFLVAWVFKGFRVNSEDN
jgi:hypothetical protein